MKICGRWPPKNKILRYAQNDKVILAGRYAIGPYGQLLKEKLDKILPCVQNDKAESDMRKKTSPLGLVFQQ